MFLKPPLMFDTVRMIREWPSRWLLEAKPGMVFVLPGTVGTTGGILCLTDTGLFISVDKDQLYNEKSITWPGTGRGIKSIKIIGTEILVE